MKIFINTPTDTHMRMYISTSHSQAHIQIHTPTQTHVDIHIIIRHQPEGVDEARLLKFVRSVDAQVPAAVFYVTETDVAVARVMQLRVETIKRECQTYDDTAFQRPYCTKNADANISKI